MKAPPFLLGYPSADAFLRRADGVYSKLEASKFLALAERGLPPVTSVNSLALLFQYSPRFIVAMALRPKRYYRHFFISKGSRQRRIDAPKVALKIVQSWFGHHLARALQADACVHGFIPKRSIVTAAKEHCLAEWVLSLDIKDFFPSVTEDQVVEVLHKVGYSSAAARLLARLFTLGDSLPQGAPSSPVIANLVFAKTDGRLLRLASKYQCAYTRYADDLTFSGKAPWPGNAFLKDVTDEIRKDGWKIARKKTRLAEAPKRLVVLGLVVNGSQPRLPKAARNKVRLMSYLLANDYCSEVDRARFKGYLAFANSVVANTNIAANE